MSDLLALAILTPFVLIASMVGGSVILLFAEHLNKKLKKKRTVEICFDKKELVKEIVKKCN